jgi:hypothetical protein
VTANTLSWPLQNALFPFPDCKTTNSLPLYLLCEILLVCHLLTCAVERQIETVLQTNKVSEFCYFPSCYGVCKNVSQ